MCLWWPSQLNFPRIYCQKVFTWILFVCFDCTTCLLQHVDSVVSALRRSRSVACGIIVPRSGFKPTSPADWKADSLPLDHQGSPWTWIFSVSLLIIWLFFCRNFISVFLRPLLISLDTFWFFLALDPIFVPSLAGRLCWRGTLHTYGALAAAALQSQRVSRQPHQSSLLTWPAVGVRVNPELRPEPGGQWWAVSLASGGWLCAQGWWILCPRLLGCICGGSFSCRTKPVCMGDDESSVTFHSRDCLLRATSWADGHGSFTQEPLFFPGSRVAHRLEGVSYLTGDDRIQFWKGLGLPGGNAHELLVAWEHASTRLRKTVSGPAWRRCWQRRDCIHYLEAHTQLACENGCLCQWFMGSEMLRLSARVWTGKVCVCGWVRTRRCTHELCHSVMSNSLWHRGL